ncbi:hypothetical protein Y032_0202g1765 [Ancylostoma ceylanicum]|uniref:Uncharacterized protein n=1 Tax=Ancylostoma ceylanicum TaxID=53326 RepID=A0A016SMY0_9BILA|nr:hypothetical protein Y032_0202g1765 [Ancylostoma ceylanicum]
MLPHYQQFFHIGRPLASLVPATVRARRFRAEMASADRIPPSRPPVIDQCRCRLVAQSVHRSGTKVAPALFGLKVHAVFGPFYFLS